MLARRCFHAAAAADGLSWRWRILKICQCREKQRLNTCIVRCKRRVPGGAAQRGTEPVTCLLGSLHNSSIATVFPSFPSAAVLALFHESLIPKSRKLPDGFWTRIFAVSEAIKQFKFPAINQSLNFDVSLIMINEEFMDAERVHMRILIDDHTELRRSHKAQTQHLVPHLDTITSLTCTPEIMDSLPFLLCCGAAEWAPWAWSPSLAAPGAAPQEALSCVSWARAVTAPQPAREMLIAKQVIRGYKIWPVQLHWGFFPLTVQSLGMEQSYN